MTNCNFRIYTIPCFFHFLSPSGQHLHLQVPRLAPSSADLQCTQRIGAGECFLNSTLRLRQNANAVFLCSRSQWEVLWMGGLSFILMFFLLPETQPTTILLHRASRLRKLTGNEKIRSKSEIDRKDETLSKVVIYALVKPLEICIKDPAILFTNLYTAFMYGTYYSFFEAFPLVYPVVYGFNVGETALSFISIAVGCLLAMIIYFSYIIFYLVPDIKKNGLRAQEHRLVPAVFGVLGPPIALFWWGKFLPLSS